jgi:hypothetical protein
MNVSRWPLGAVLLATLAMQGCASTGGVDYAKGAEAPPASQSASPKASPGTATSPGSEPIVKADNAADFAAVVAAVQKQMAPNGRYQFVDKDQRSTIDAKFAEMQSQFDKFGSVDKMDADSKMRLFNDQEVVNGILTQNDANRLVCERETPTGSHLSTRVCRTYGEIKENQRNAQNHMQDLDTLQGQRRQITESPVHTANGSH